MKNNKKLIITIIIVLILLLLCGGILAYTYFATDLFKSAKEVFYKYALQNISEVSNTVRDEDLENYLEKKQNTPYNNNGNIGFTSQSASTSEQNKFSPISFEGKSDLKNSYKQENLSVDYSSNVKLPFTYIQDGNRLALGSQEIVNKYLTVNNDKISELASKLKINNAENIPNKINLSELKFTTDDINALQSKYVKILEENIPESSYKKNSGNCELSLNHDQYINTFSKIVEQLKNEDIILNKISDEKAKSGYQYYIDQLQDKINNIDEKGYLKIIVYKCDKESAKVEIEDNNSTITIASANNQVSIKDNNGTNTLVFKKNKTAENLEDTINIKLSDKGGKTTEVQLTANYKGLNSNAKVAEQINFNISNPALSEKDIIKLTVDYKDEVEFVDSVLTEKLTNDNSVDINNYSGDQIATIQFALIMQILNVNSSKMQQAGLQNNNTTNIVNSLLY